MAAGSESENISQGKNQDEFYWEGDADQDFSVSAEELEEAIELREEWIDEIEYDRWGTEDWTAVKISPSMQDAEKNSRASGDANVLHNEPEVVEELSASDEYPFVREPVQESPVVVSQGMSFVDALSPEFDRPLEYIEGEWSKMVYAGDNPDHVVLSNNGTEGFQAVLLPGGQVSEAMEAGRITPGYAEDPEVYNEEHNTYMTSLADQAVGRSFSTPDDIRNGELLISNRIESNKPVEWVESEEFLFEISEITEDGPQINIEWDIHVDYGEEVEENALSYTETSMYTEGFEDLKSVNEVYSDTPNPFSAYVEAATTASLLPLKAGNAALRSMTDDK